MGLTRNTTKTVPLPSRSRRAPSASSSSDVIVRVALIPEPAAIFSRSTPETRVALLIPCLAVMPVIDADDREIGRIHHRYRRERADIHQQLAVSGDDEHSLVGTGEREAEAYRASPAHRACHRVGVRPVTGQSRDVAARAREPADDQEILVPADQGRYRIAPVEDELRGGGPFHASIALICHPASPQQSKTLTRLAALGTLSRSAGEGGSSPKGLVGEGSAEFHHQNCFAPSSFWVSSTATA